MSIVADIRVLRALTVVSSDDGRALRIRNQNFKSLPVETGDSIDFDAYEDRLAAAQRFPASISAQKLARKFRKTCSRRDMCPRACAPCSSGSRPPG